MASYNSRFIGLDLEATDLSTERGRILEVAAVRYEKGKEVGEFQTLINPGQPIPPIITSITGIREQDVVGMPTFDEVRDKFAEFIEDVPIIGHNIKFDINFLKAQGLPLKNPLFDTWKLATMLLPRAPSHSLEALAQGLQLNHPEAHRALHDARVGAELFMYLADRMAELSKEVAGPVLSVIKKGPYSLKQFFGEVLEKHKAQTKPTMDWRVHSDHALEKKPEGDLLDLSDLKKVFEEGVAKVLPSFEIRPGQIELIKDLKSKLKKPEVSVLEVGRGVGRRYAAIIVGLNSGAAKKGPTVYAVSTKHELESNFIKAGQLADIFGKKVALLDTDASYICKKPFERFLAKEKMTETEIGMAIKVLIWLNKTTTGHLKEVATVWEEELLLQELSAESHSCTSKPEPKLCSYCSALEQASKADLIMVSHETLFWLLDQKDQAIDIGRVILDDAQYLEDHATKSLGHNVYQDELERLLGRLKDYEAIKAAAEKAETQLLLLSGLVGVFVERHAREVNWAGRRELVLNAPLMADLDYQKLKAATDNFKDILLELTNDLDKSDSDVLRGFSVLVANTAHRLSEFIAAEPTDWVIQLGLNEYQKIVFKKQPIAVKNFLEDRLYKTKKPIALLGPRLTVDKSFKFIKERLGLPAKVTSKQIDSDIAVEENTALISLEDHPDSREPGWVDATAQIIAQTSLELKGRILVLFSNRSGIVAVNSALEDALRGTGVRLFAQGITGGRGKNLQMLGKEEHAVFLATYNFAHGLKFKHGFKSIVLTRLPFSVPTEPLYEAQRRQYAQAFMELEIPRVALKIREQFDRLISQKGERGVMIVMDHKFLKGYGASFIDSLPPVTHHVVPSANLQEVIAPFKEK